jgi:hypothetical protein
VMLRVEERGRHEASCQRAQTRETVREKALLGRTASLRGRPAKAAGREPSLGNTAGPRPCPNGNACERPSMGKTAGGRETPLGVAVRGKTALTYRLALGPAL